jgi:hypothetical protein
MDKPSANDIFEKLPEACKGIKPATVLQVWDNCLEVMYNLYWPPFKANDDRQFKDQIVCALSFYVSALYSQNADSLKKAFAATMASHKPRQWPTIAEILGNIPSPVLQPVLVSQSFQDRASGSQKDGMEYLLQLSRSSLDKVRCLSWLQGSIIVNDRLLVKDQLTANWVNANMKELLINALGPNFTVGVT